MQGLAMVMAGEYPRRFFPMGKTPPVLRMVGMPDVRISVHAHVLYKAVADFLGLPKKSNKNRHNVSPDVMKQLPAQINDPVAIFTTSNPRTKERAFGGYAGMESYRRRSGQSGCNRQNSG